MPTATTIRRLVATPLDIPLCEPFGIAGGATNVAESVVVALELEGGAVGYGEASPLPPFNGETRQGALATLATMHAAVVGEDARAWRAVAARASEHGSTSGAARCALETALLDALTKHIGLPLWSFFGGAERRLVTDVTIPIASVQDARRAARARAAEGFARLKVKVGGPRAGDDLARLLSVHEAAPEAALMLDGNGGLTAEAALDLLVALRARGVTPILFEQPVPADDLAGLASVARKGGVPVAADESVTTASDVLRVAALGAAEVVNIKLMKSGVVEALAIASAARAAGLRLMIGGMIEARLAMSMSASFAAGLGGFAFVDLDTPLFLAEDPFSGGYVGGGPELDLAPIRAGHGVTPILVAATPG
jgi:L-alanine-DL-glutamate epimerase-like enolase superfamily enzyme